MKKVTLQWRITILTALVLLTCTVTLTALSMHNVQPLYWLAGNQPEAVWDTEDAYAYQNGEPVPAPVQLAKEQFDGKSILFCGLFTVLGTVAVYFVTGHALRPLRRLSDKVETVDERNLSVRLPEAEANDEVGRLTDSFNRMLSRLDDAFLRQKRFTANAAHELKTPLATLKTGVQVLEADQNATLADYREQNQITLASTDRLTGIVDDLLVLASAGEDGGEEQEPVFLEPLLDAVCGEMAARLDQRRMTCHVDCGELSVMGIPAFLYRVFFNLMDNACKYGTEGGNIWVSARVCPEGTEIRFWDDGPGVAPEHLPYLFDAFYRVDKSRSRELGGSGLGLSIVKTMVEACGGSISVRSSGETGLCFLLSFAN